MSKQPLTPLLSLAMLSLTAPQALWAQAEYDQSPNANLTLDTVVVTATRTEESLREVTANTTVITAEQIRNSPAKSLDEVLVRQGFQVVNNGAAKLLKIRGLGQNSMANELESNVLALINGRRIGANNVAIMGLDNVDQIEIIRGPSAVQFGSAAMGGVVNVITKRGAPGETEFAVEVGLGSFDLHKEMLSLSGGVGAFDFSGSVTNWGRNNYDVSGGHEWKDTGLGSSTTMNLDMGYSFFEKHRIGVNFNYYNQNDSDFPGYGWVGTHDPDNWYFYNTFDESNHNLAILYEGATEDDRFNWFARYSFGENENEMLSRPSYFTQDTLKNNSLAAQLAYNGEIFSLAAGLDYLKYDFDRKATGDPSLSSSQKNTAGYLSSKLRLWDETLIVSAGGRYDHFKNEVSGFGSKNDNNFSPSIGLAVLPNDWLKFRANYSEGFKIASPRQITGFNTSMGNYAPNYDLSPEKSKTFEIGADIAWNYLDAGLTYFHTNWENKIIGDDYAANPGSYRYQYINLNKASISGLEFSFGADLGQALGWDFNLRPYVNLTYLMSRKNKDQAQIAKNEGQSALLDTPEYTISYGLDLAYSEYDLKANLNAVYSGETLTHDYRMAAGSYDAAWNWAPNPAYGRIVKHSGGTVVDLHLEKGLITFDNCSKLSLKVDVNNLFDGGNDAYLDYLGPGRNFYVGLRYEYK